MCVCVIMLSYYRLSELCTQLEAFKKASQADQVMNVNKPSLMECCHVSHRPTLLVITLPITLPTWVMRSAHSLQSVFFLSEMITWLKNSWSEDLFAHSGLRHEWLYFTHATLQDAMCGNVSCVVVCYVMLWQGAYGKYVLGALAISPPFFSESNTPRLVLSLIPFPPSSPFLHFQL